MFDFLGGGGPGQGGNAGPGNAGNAGAAPGFDWLKLANAGASLGPQPATPGAQAGVADQMQAMQRQRREMEMWELLKKRLAQQKMQAGQMPDAMGDIMGGGMGAGY